MAVAWPATLPAPIANSVKLHTQKNTRTIEFSAKNRRTTTRASKPPSIVECEISMDSVQLDAFDYFIKFDLSYGAHWIDASWLLPLGFSSHFARFLELPKINKRGGRFTVSCVFEIVLQYVAVQMPNAGIYKTSNYAPPPPIPMDGLLAHFDASTVPVGNVYAYDNVLPDSLGMGFTFRDRQNQAYSSQIVSVNGFNAIELRTYNRGNSPNVSRQALFPNVDVSNFAYMEMCCVVTNKFAVSCFGKIMASNLDVPSYTGSRAVIFVKISRRFFSIKNWRYERAISIFINGVFYATNRYFDPTSPQNRPSYGYDIDFGFKHLYFGANRNGDAARTWEWVIQNYHELMAWNPSAPLDQSRIINLSSHLMNKWLIV